MGPSLVQMSTRIALLGDKDLGLLTHRELDAAVALFPGWAEPLWVGTDSAGARARGRRRALGDPGLSVP